MVNSKISSNLAIAQCQYDNNCQIYQTSHKRLLCKTVDNQ